MMMAMALCAYYGYDVDEIIAKSQRLERPALTVDEYPPRWPLCCEGERVRDRPKHRRWRRAMRDQS